MTEEKIIVPNREELAQAGLKAIRTFNEVNDVLSYFTVDHTINIINQIQRPLLDIEVPYYYAGKSTIDSSCRRLDIIPLNYDELKKIASRYSFLTDTLNNEGCGEVEIERRYDKIKTKFKKEFQEKEKFRNRIAKRIVQQPLFPGLRRLVNESL